MMVRKLRMKYACSPAENMNFNFDRLDSLKFGEGLVDKNS